MAAGIDRESGMKGSPDMGCELSVAHSYAVFGSDYERVPPGRL